MLQKRAHKSRHKLSANCTDCNLLAMFFFVFPLFMFAGAFEFNFLHFGRMLSFVFLLFFAMKKKIWKREANVECRAVKVDQVVWCRSNSLFLLWNVLVPAVVRCDWFFVLLKVISSVPNRVKIIVTIWVTFFCKQLDGYSKDNFVDVVVGGIDDVFVV